MNISNQTSDRRKQLLRRFFPNFFGTESQGAKEELSETTSDKESAPILEEATPDIEMLQGVRAELHRIRKMRNAELDKVERHVREIKELEHERITLLTKAKIEEDESFKEEAEKQLKMISRLERERKDSVGIAEQLADQAEALEPKIKELERASLIQLGKYLEGRMSELVDHYN